MGIIHYVYDSGSQIRRSNILIFSNGFYVYGLFLDGRHNFRMAVADVHNTNTTGTIYFLSLTTRIVATSAGSINFVETLPTPLEMYLDQCWTSCSLGVLFISLPILAD